MARMPQIPQTEVGRRPDGEVPRAALPNIDGGAKAFATGADAVEGLADQAAKYERQQQEATTKRQGIVDTVNATNAAGDYRDKTSSILSQLQEKYLNTPDAPQLKSELLDQLNQAASDAMADPRHNENVAGMVAKHAATINNQMRASMADWQTRRSTVLAKSTLTEMEFKQTHGLDSVYSAQGLEMRIREAHTNLDPLYDQLSGDPGKAKEGLSATMAKQWAEQRSATPNGAFGVLAALSDPKGILQRTLKADEVTSITKKATASFKGGGVTAELNALAAAHKDISDVLGLAAASDPGFMPASLAKRAKIQQDIEATKANTDHLPADSRAARLQTLNTSAQIIDTVDMLYRSNPGVFREKVDGKITADILARARSPFMKDTAGLGDHLQDLLTLRRDAAVALQNGTLSKTAYETVETKLQLAIPKSQAAQDKGMAVHVAGHDIGFLSPIQAGNRRMDELLDAKGFNRNFTQDQKNAAWETYYAKLNAAHKGDLGAGAVNKDTARVMAQEAVEYARGAGQ